MADPEKRFRAAKVQFSLAALAVLRGDADAVKVAAAALAELDAALAELRGKP